MSKRGVSRSGKQKIGTLSSPFRVLFLQCLESSPCRQRVEGSNPISSGRRITLLPSKLGMMAACLFLASIASRAVGADMELTGPAPAPAEPSPADFKYTHLWSSGDGETHVAECRMQNFSMVPYSSLPQFVRTGFGGDPTQVDFTQLSVGFTQPLHNSPQPQFVVTLFGRWYIITTDGTRKVFGKGEILYQDNIKSSPTKKVPQHYSGNVGTVGCQQILIQMNRPPEADKPCPF